MTGTSDFRGLVIVRCAQQQLSVACEKRNLVCCPFVGPSVSHSFCLYLVFFVFAGDGSFLWHVTLCLVDRRLC